MALRRPRNWNPVTVKILALDAAASHYDPVFGTPRNRIARTTEHTYRAQVNLKGKDQDKKVRALSGDVPINDGWLVLRTVDLAPNTALPKPEKGWQIVVLFVGTDQEQVVDYLIEEVRHESQLRGRPLLLYLPFKENVEHSRQP